MVEVGALIRGVSRNYVVLGEHASGGMSRTYRARTCAPVAPETESDAAKVPEVDVLLKVTSFAGMRDWRAFERFEREARTLSSLSHPRIPKSLELFAWDGTNSMDPSSVTMGETPIALIHVQELVPGRSLADALKAGVRFSGEQLETLYRELLGTLGYLHALLPAVLHRDLQPRNVILDQEGHPHLVDFGLSSEHPARGTDALGQTSAHSVPLGAPGYVAPELVLGVAGPKADLYALAATILSAASHLAATDFPRDAKTGRILVSKASPGLPPRLARALERSLDVDVRKRTPTAEEVRRLLSDRVSLASRVSFGATRARIAAVGALALVFVLTPIGLKVRAHARAVRETQELVLAKGSFPKPVGTDTRAPSVEGDETESKAEEPKPAPAAVPTPEPPKPIVEWQGSVVATMSGGPPQGARCALTLLNAEGGDERACSMQLTCEAGSTGTTIVFDRLFGRSPEEGGCAVVQVSDVIPGHYRYSVRATLEDDGDDTIFVDTASDVVRVSRHHSGGAGEVKVRLDPSSHISTAADVFGRATTFPATVRYRGSVRSVLGPAPIAFGATCVAEFTPRLSKPRNCSVDVTCGGKSVYKGVSSTCTLDEDGRFASFQDFESSMFDDTPRMNIGSKQFEIADETAQGSWKVALEMNPEK